VLEVHADALLGKEQIAAAIPLFDRLLKEFPANSKYPAWQVRRGLASYLAGDFAAAGQSLETLAPTLSDPQLAAEAWHWVGQVSCNRSSLTRLLRRSTSRERRAVRGDARRKRSRCWLRLRRRGGDAKAAEQTLAELRQKFPEHRSAADAELRLAKQAFASGEFREHWKSITVYCKFPLRRSLRMHFTTVPGVCRNSAAGETESRLNERRTRFAKVTTDYPQHELAPLAVAEWRLWNARQGVRPSALSTLDQFLQGNAEHPRGRCPI
jgi:outer membrane protein assembly factor BamD (BamD/ComL family)